MDDTLKFDFPDSVNLDTFKPLSNRQVLDYATFVNTIGSSAKSEILKSKNLLIVVNDAHRSTPTSQILTWFKKYSPKQFTSASFLVACGTHKKPTEEDCQIIFGELYDEVKDSLFFHDCHKNDELQLVGIDSFGEEVYLNSKVFEHDKVWVINSVEPHYFAGFTGGRKSLIPGLADFKTIERNHNLANSLDCSPLKLHGNPVAEHLEAILNMVEQQNIASMQIVSDTQKNIIHLTFGTIQDSFENAVEFATKVYATNCDENYDLLLLEILPPLDKSIYQAQKALENCQSVVKDSGTVIIFSACKEGIGSEHFYTLAENWDKENNCPNDGKLSFGSHKLKRVNDISQRIQVLLKSTLDENIVTKLFYQPIENISTYVEELISDNNNLKVGIVFDAAHFVLKKKI